ncbi:putative integral membrane protein [Babesia bovis T2Bo]|uniref:Membrane protein, putative n=1 Tax=Babesia bovis TaxID=5865 RepID=A7ALY8_BABBO|nr:putative integral membrane protein [Babesia bovis T2Bo]EDO07572.1 putative integral membrane protein [Babesia bovis T2Bo]|eukprot:XP_001611140.1 membrane protein [Babesia bovis T2Bo]
MSSQDTVEALPWYQWMFMVVLVLGVAMAVALIVRTVLLATGYGSGYGGDGNSDPLCSTLSFMVLLCYIGLHLLGYYCQYVKTPLCRPMKALIAFGMILVVTACYVTFTLTTNYTQNADKTAYIVVAISCLQVVAFVGFVVTLIFNGCFSKDMSIKQCVFYVLGSIATLCYIGYIASLQWYYYYYAGAWHSDTANIRNNTTACFKILSSLNNVLLGCSVLSAYQVNMCCTPWSRWDVLLLVLLGSALGVLLIVIISGTNGQIGIYGYYNGNTDFYCLVVLHLVLLVATLLVCHYRMPFPGKYELWRWDLSLWDTMLVLLVLDSLVVLVVAVVQKDQTENCSALLTLHAIVCGAALGIVHFKEPLSQYWPRDRVSCGVLSLVSLVTWIGVASYHDKLLSASSTDLDAKVYCLVAYAIITFGGALYYGFRSGLVQGRCFTKKSGSSSTQLQGSDEAVSGTESIANSTEDIVTEVPLPEDNTALM